MGYDGRSGQRSALLTWLSSAVAESGAELTPDLLCALACRRLEVDGVLLVISVGNGAVATHAVGAAGLRLADLELTTGQGPLTTARASGVPVLVGDLTTHAAATRWPLFSQSGTVSDIAAVFAFPMAIGAVRLGTFGAYRVSTGTLSAVALVEAALFARMAMDLVVAETVPLTRPQIHQATGMVAVQLGVDMSAAFASLRARAFAEGRELAGLAEDVVARRVRFALDHPGTDHDDRRDEGS
ncbi:ANTAR domain-containing protein [Actinokineospora enzanensis]|uniref:ANTAR domain-containing protein n=1 Tax=Actinokineospora enzanensis TaxID=155975 RepID=UPI0003665B9B|nr:ANTAR domain-containing protein [Actinokineospora enzanensis]